MASLSDKLSGLVRLSRPKHWSKNAFVLMPVPFALAAGATFDPWRFLLGFLAISLTNSAAYAFNDARDAEADRQHPRKRDRPVAAGTISVTAALAWSVVLLLVGLALAWLSGSRTAVVIVGVYTLVNVAYSLGAKHLALIDVFLLSSGFVLRVLLGCALVDVQPSNWLLLCSSTLALFLSLEKRRADIARGVGPDHRPSLGGYNVAFLDQAIAISAGMTMMAYGLYCVEADVLLAGREFASLPFVAFGVFEYLRLAQIGKRSDSPVELLLSSPTIWAAGVGWAIATVWSLGLV